MYTNGRVVFFIRVIHHSNIKRISGNSEQDWCDNACFTSLRPGHHVNSLLCDFLEDSTQRNTTGNKERNHETLVYSFLLGHLLSDLCSEEEIDVRVVMLTSVNLMVDGYCRDLLLYSAVTYLTELIEWRG